MLANITFKAYESPNKELTSLLTEFTLEFVDTDSINTITEAIEKAYEYSCPVSWSIDVDHTYI